MYKQQVKPDIFDVAKAAGVSISTVSRSYNHPNLVKPSTRKKIEKATQKIGYIRNRAAQIMHGRRSSTIGLVVPTINNAIFAEVIQSFSESLDNYGFTMLIASHGFNLKREYKMVKKFLEHRVDGLAFIGLEHSEATIQLIQQQQVPSLAIWNFKEEAEFSCVGVDNNEAGRLAAKHLLDLGHRKIGLIFPSLIGNDRARDRMKGVKFELERLNVTTPKSWQIESPYSLDEAKRAGIKLLTNNEIPSAILCGNDIIAQGVIYAAKLLGIKIPKDLSIMGIGDFNGSAEIEPSLSTVRIPAMQIGSLAADYIFKAITEKPSEILAIRCDLSIIERDSTDSYS